MELSPQMVTTVPIRQVRERSIRRPSADGKRLGRSELLATGCWLGSGERLHLRLVIIIVTCWVGTWWEAEQVLQLPSRLRVRADGRRRPGGAARTRNQGLGDGQLRLCKSALVALEPFCSCEPGGLVPPLSSDVLLRLRFRSEETQASVM